MCLLSDVHLLGRNRRKEGRELVTKREKHHFSRKCTHTVFKNNKNNINKMHFKYDK